MGVKFKVTGDSKLNDNPELVNAKGKENRADHRLQALFKF